MFEPSVRYSHGEITKELDFGYQSTHDTSDIWSRGYPPASSGSVS